jgi:hypothetical protein
VTVPSIVARVGGITSLTLSGETTAGGGTRRIFPLRMIEIKLGSPCEMVLGLGRQTYLKRAGDRFALNFSPGPNLFYTGLW